MTYGSYPQTFEILQCINVTGYILWSTGGHKQNEMKVTERQILGKAELCNKLSKIGMGLY